MSCYRITRRLIRSSTVNNWTIWRKLLSRSDLHWSTDSEWSFIRTMRGRIHLWLPYRIWWIFRGIVFPTPSYSSDLALSDYHLFRSLQNSLNGKTFDSLDEAKIHLDRFFESKDAIFWLKKWHETAWTLDKSDWK